MMDLIALQHRLPSIAPMLRRLSEMGIFDKINLLSKHYSRIEGDFLRDIAHVQEFSGIEDAERGLGPDRIVLDEGGVLHAHLAGVAGVAGVEQTSFGNRALWRWPTVLVCRSGAKLEYESGVIARGIITKLESLMKLRDRTIGIVGTGALGTAVCRRLARLGVSFFFSDIASRPADLGSRAVPIGELLQQCDVILGCTGRDCLRGLFLPSRHVRLVFASCSSSTVEFASLLKQCHGNSEFETRNGVVDGTEVSVLNGGYPINFDREREWERSDEIILTRMLVCEGVLQAIDATGTPPKGLMLSPAAQLKVIRIWRDAVGDPELRRGKEPTEDALRSKSEGEIELSQKPYVLHETTPAALVKMRSHQREYVVAVRKLELLVCPDVWSPAYDWSGEFHLENLPDVDGLDVLEIGCGCGLISVHAGLMGARSVTAVDVNPAAVDNTRRNFGRFGLTDARCFRSDCFGSVHGKYDIIVWNAPFHGTAANSMLELGCADFRYRSVREFFRRVPLYMRAGGRVIFGFSYSGDVELLLRLIADAGLVVRSKVSDWRQGYNCLLFTLSKSLEAEQSDRSPPCHASRADVTAVETRMVGLPRQGSREPKTDVSHRTR